VHKTWKEINVAYFKLPHWNSHGQTMEDEVKGQNSRYSGRHWNRVSPEYSYGDLWL